MLRNVRRQLGARSDLRCREDWVEALLAQVVERDLVAVGAQRFDSRVRDRMIEAALPRVAEDDEDVHDRSCATL